MSLRAHARHTCTHICKHPHTPGQSELGQAHGFSSCYSSRNHRSTLQEADGPVGVGNGPTGPSKRQTRGMFFPRKLAHMKSPPGQPLPDSNMPSVLWGSTLCQTPPPGTWAPTAALSPGVALVHLCVISLFTTRERRFACFDGCLEWHLTYSRCSVNVF